MDTIFAIDISVEEKIKAGVYYFNEPMPTEHPGTRLVNREVASLSKEEFLLVGEFLSNQEEYRQKYQKQMNDWYSRLSACKNVFWEDLAKEFEVTNHKKLERLEDIVRGHTSNLQEQYDLYSDLVDLMK